MEKRVLGRLSRIDAHEEAPGCVADGKTPLFDDTLNFEDTEFIIKGGGFGNPDERFFIVMRWYNFLKEYYKNSGLKEGEHTVIIGCSWIHGIEDRLKENGIKFVEYELNDVFIRMVV